MRFAVRLWQASRHIETILKTRSNNNNMRKEKETKKIIQRSAMYSFSTDIAHKLTFPCFYVLYILFSALAV